MGVPRSQQALNLDGDRVSLGVDLAFSPPPAPPPLPPPPPPSGCRWDEAFFWNPSTRTKYVSHCAESATESVTEAEYRYEYQSSNGSGDNLALSYGQCDTQAACVEGGYRGSACQWQSELITQDTQLHVLRETISLSAYFFLRGVG